MSFGYVPLRLMCQDVLFLDISIEVKFFKWGCTKGSEKEKLGEGNGSRYIPISVGKINLACMGNSFGFRTI